jgi:hypothetical protein
MADPRCSLAILLTALASAQESPAPAPPSSVAEIAAERLLEDACFLAAPTRGGRMTASPGQEQAAEFVAARLRELGLEPLGDAGDGEGRSWLQRYPLQRTRIARGATLGFGGAQHTANFAVLAGAEGAALELAGDIVFEGATPSLDGAPLAGRIPVLVVREPAVPARVDVQMSVGFQTLARLGGLTRRLQRRGAQAAIACLLDDEAGVASVLNTLAPMPGRDLLAPAGQSAALDTGVAGALPLVFTSAALSTELLAALGLDAGDLAALRAADRDAQAAIAAKTKTVPGRLDVRVIADGAFACNVAAVRRGSDAALAQEAVLFSAHMDHMGLRLDGKVFCGADDNASGTAGLLAIARAFAKAPPPPRSVVFLAVSGEELGLWGSQHFVAAPSWPLADIVAAINIDMIGRDGDEAGSGEVAVTPSFRHEKFSTLARDAAQCAEHLGLRFTSGDKYYYRSDHYNFARAGVPVVFFTNGEHEDYHQVTDTGDKLLGNKMESIARLAFWTGWRAAHAAERPRTLGRARGWLESDGR